MVPLVPKLAVTTPGARVAGADGAHHVVAAAGADEHVGDQAELLRAVGACSVPGRLVAANQRRQLVRRGPASIAVERRLRPLALAHVQQRRAAGVAVLHDLLAGEPEVQVVVRQQHVAQPAKFFGSCFLSQRIFERGEAGQDSVAQLRGWSP